MIIFPGNLGIPLLQLAHRSDLTAFSSWLACGVLYIILQYKKRAVCMLGWVLNKCQFPFCKKYEREYTFAPPVCKMYLFWMLLLSTTENKILQYILQWEEASGVNALLAFYTVVLPRRISENSFSPSYREPFLALPPTGHSVAPARSIFNRTLLGLPNPKLAFVQSNPWESIESIDLGEWRTLLFIWQTYTYFRLCYPSNSFAKSCFGG